MFPRSAGLQPCGRLRPAMKRAPIRVLIVDDDRRTRVLLRSYLSEMGFSVSVAEDGTHLEDAIERERVDLVVLDLMLPGEDGLNLCRGLRTRGHDVPIIMLDRKSTRLNSSHLVI